MCQVERGELSVVGKDKVLIQKYADDFSIPTEIAEIVARRYPEHSEAREFLYPHIDQLHDPTLMPDISVAAEMIMAVIKKGEGVLIYTHDDVDGYTSAAVMYKALDDLTRSSSSVHVYPVVREKDGYILNPAVLREYRERGVRLLLTVDFGISNEENFRIAEQEGLAAIICDHHETQLSNFPIAAVNPKRPDSQYPFRELAGVGVAFKLAQFLYQRFFGISVKEFYGLKKNLFPMVCIGTFADRVVLSAENRIFCKYGMDLINKIAEPWVTCLKKEGDVDIQRVLKEVIPAVGSAAYSDPRLGVDFFISADVDRVTSVYQKLRATDQKRRQEIDALFSEVITSAEVMPELVISIVPLSKQHYLGSVASRLRDYFKRNSIIIGLKDEKCVGELRSCNLDLYKLLFKMRDYFRDFGGHKKAAGFSMDKSNLESFLARLKEYITNKVPDIEDECGTRNLAPEAFMRRSDIGMLEVLAPFGEGNPAPILTDGSSLYTIDNTFNLSDVT